MFQNLMSITPRRKLHRLHTIQSTKLQSCSMVTMSLSRMPDIRHLWSTQTQGNTELFRILESTVRSLIQATTAPFRIRGIIHPTRIQHRMLRIPTTGQMYLQATLIPIQLLWETGTITQLLRKSETILNLTAMCPNHHTGHLVRRIRQHLLRLSRRRRLCRLHHRFLLNHRHQCRQ